MEKTYSISELEKITGLSRRTIHYYTMEKLIAPPDGAGSSAKYGEENLLRLILIIHMQKSHIRLTGIREALESMTTEDMRCLIDEINTSRAAWDFESIKNWLNGNSAVNHSLQSAPADSRVSKMNYSFVSKPQADINVSVNSSGSGYLRQLKRKPVVTDSFWKRLTVIDGLEINIRSDVEELHGQILLPFIEQIKKII
ncbi:MAG: MerR family transcriptional regulator [Ignavibacteria bacterium]